MQAIAIELAGQVEQRVRPLLRDDETSIPNGLRATVQFFLERGLWFRLARNAKVLSCRDAASRRQRLGHEGIALQDELRSYLVEIGDKRNRSYALFHCRASARFDVDKAQQHPRLQGLGLRRAELEELTDGQMGYGLVNPFTASAILGVQSDRIVQLFDPTVVDDSGETGTMMTNAGDYTWAVEFDPKQLLDEINPIGELFPIATSEEPDDRPATIGILTGNAPESGALLWRKVNGALRRRLGDNFRGDVSYPKVLVHSLPAMGWSMELAERDRMLRSMLLEQSRILADQGAKVIALACNTTQYYVGDINDSLSPYGAEVVSLGGIVQRFMQQHIGEKVFLAGIGYVTSDARWSAFAESIVMPNAILPDQKQAAAMVELAYRVKQGESEGITYQKLRSLFRGSNASHFLLLLTELSQIFQSFPRKKLGDLSVVDSLDIYAEEIARIAVSRSSVAQIP